MENKNFLTMTVLLLVSAVASSSRYYRVFGPNGRIDEDQLKELDITLPEMEHSPGAAPLEVNVIEFPALVPLEYRLDALWTVTMATPDLAGFNVTWNNDGDGVQVAECFVAGKENNTIYSTMECEDVVLKPCVNLYHIITPVDADGRDIGVGDIFITSYVPLTDELNYACHLDLIPVEDWINVQFYMINGDQALVNCSVTWTEVKANKQVAECEVDCNNWFKFSPLGVAEYCDPDVTLMPDTEYQVTVQPHDETGPIGHSESAMARTTSAL